MIPMDNRTGLSDKEVTLSRKRYGSNKIDSSNSDGFFRLFIETLGDPIIKILLIALAIKCIVLIRDFDFFETIGIAIAILVASLISALSEYGSSKAFARLQEESSKIKCRVKRNAGIHEINIDEIVVSDIVNLQTGDMVPADGIIIWGSVAVDESSINGESKEVYKEKCININNYNDNNFVYRGTTIYEGNAYMQVTKVGKDTFYGNMAMELQEKNPTSPLKLRLSKLASIISRIGYVGAVLVAISFLFSKIVIENNFDMVKIQYTISNIPLLIGYLLHALTLSVTIIVVAVPEGLPMMITLVLSSNMKKMLKNNVLVRKLVGIETAGSLNILFTDKTGTLTKGELQVTGVMTGDMRMFNQMIEMDMYPHYQKLVKLSLVYNNASYYDMVEKTIIGGNITDKAILSFVKMNKNPQIQIIQSMAFDSKKKYAMTIINSDGKRMKLVKGAFEKIIDNCSKYYDVHGNKKILNKQDLVRKINDETKKGIRVLCIAIGENTYVAENMHNLTLVGVIFIKDEVRKEAIQGIEMVKKAGIKTIMITGDNKDTAYAIGKEVGLVDSDKDLIFTSSEINMMSDDEIKKKLPYLKIVARAMPSDKSRLVKLSQECNLVVGMTGDGVNDAPALKKADVGFAMGSGTEVAKEASDIVIIDDNFMSIAKAVLFGRTIFKSIRKFIIFQLTVNLCAVSVSIVGPFIGIPSPVTVIQMLWINMVMDTLAGLAFAHEPALYEYMEEPPKKKDEAIINSYMLNEIVITGIYSSVLCIIFLKSDFIRSFFRSGDYMMTAFFGLFIFIGIFNSFNARTYRLNLFSSLLKNKAFIIVISFIVVVQIYLIYFGGSMFRTVGLNLQEFVVMLLLALTVIPVDFIRRMLLKRKNVYRGV